MAEKGGGGVPLVDYTGRGEIVLVDYYGWGGGGVPLVHYNGRGEIVQITSQETRVDDPMTLNVSPLSTTLARHQTSIG